MTNLLNKLKKTRFLAAAAAVTATSLIAFIPTASAAYLTNTSIVLTNMNTSAASNVIVQFTTPASSPGTAAGSLQFAGWTGAGNTGTVATPTVSTCSSIYSSDTAIPGTLTPTATAATGTISWTDTSTLSTSTTYCFTLVGAISANPLAAGQTTTTLTEGTSTATLQSIDIIASDQIGVTASVPTSFSMGFGTSDGFGSLSYSAINTSTGVSLTVGTNAKSGWSVWASDSNVGLKSSTQSYTVPSKTPGSNGSLTIGTEGYLTGITAANITQTSGTGSPAPAAPFTSSGTGNGSGLNGTNALLVSSGGTANNAIVPIKEYAEISSTTPAANDYADTITLVGAGSF